MAVKNPNRLLILKKHLLRLIFAFQNYTSVKEKIRKWLVRKNYSKRKEEAGFIYL